MSESIAGTGEIVFRRERSVRGFFPAVAVIMLAILVLGFTPTLLLRPYFAVAPMPAYLFVHGAVLFAWFIWFFVQTALVATQRTDLHRRTGIVGVAIAVCVVAASLMAIVNWIPRLRAMGANFDAEGARVVAGVVGDSLMLVQFIPLVAFAIARRNTPAMHKRLMFLASLAILGPAGTRTPATFAALGLQPAVAPFIAYFLFTLIAPFAYDFLTRRRPHAVTVLCTVANFGSVALGFTLAGQESVRRYILEAF